MNVTIRLPNITATSDAEKLLQVQNYMYQLVTDLNWALNNIEFGSGANEVTPEGNAAANAQKEDPVASFNNIKALIIRSAEIVNAYAEVIERRLEGKYVAASDFGTYTEETAQIISESSTDIEQLFSNIQQITTDIESVEHSISEVNAHIKSGVLFYDAAGIPVYGLEIGQRNKVDGEEVFNKYARFTSDKLSFYDQNDNEIAYISDKKLYISNVEITVSYKMGGFIDTVLSDKSVVTKWVGGV